MWATGASMMFRMSWDLLKASTGELTDSSLPEEVEKEIEDIICSQEQIHEPQYPGHHSHGTKKNNSSIFQPFGERLRLTDETAPESGIS